MDLGIGKDNLFLIFIYAAIGLVALSIVSGLFLSIVNAINGSSGHAAILKENHPWEGAHQEAAH